MNSSRAAIVTGAARGIGFSTARLLAERGIAVTLADLSPAVTARAEELRDAGATALGVVADVSDPAAVADLTAQARAAHGDTAILVNNAGLTAVHRDWMTVTPEQWDQVMAVNVRSMFLCSRAVVEEMTASHWGRIVNISSVTFLSGQRDLIDYVASKGAVVGFTRTLAREVGRHGITANAVSPGAIRTEAELEIFPEQEESMLAATLAVQAVQRRGTPEDIASAVGYLCSDEAGFISGQNLVVDGGWLLN